MLGTSKIVNLSIFDTGVKFIRDRANDEPLDEAVQNAESGDPSVRENPTTTVNN
jgi:hypothetical protein